MKQVLAAVAHSPGEPLIVQTAWLDAPRSGEILERVQAVGICHTDAVQGGSLPMSFPAVFGHEGVGRVEQVGEGVSAVKPGDTVVLTFDHCGTCTACRRRDPSHCAFFFPRNFGGTRPDGSTTLTADDRPLHGSFFGQPSFASHAICTEANAVRVDESVPLHLLAPVV